MTTPVIQTRDLCRTRLWSHLGAAMLALGLFTSPAAAQDHPTSTDRALGNWTFQSVPYRDNSCQMSGKMQIRPSVETGGLSCAFTAVEACIGEDRWIVEQTCEVQQNGNQIAMRSSIINFIESDLVPETYVPDHFVLRIDSASKMSGQLISAITADVEFVRQEENVS